MKEMPWLNDHILVFIHFPLNPVIKSEATTLWPLVKDSLTDYLGFFNFTRSFFFLSPSMPQLLWDLLEGRNTDLLLNILKTIIEMSKERKKKPSTIGDWLMFHTVAFKEWQIFPGERTSLLFRKSAFLSMKRSCCKALCRE